mmetsp:Transcript_1953/g.2916  ORF Transcript_1953/g.2916 Transcript_1953/m.2916 type:complete len:293 (+) Transcript_1953:210-1088(+)
MSNRASLKDQEVPVNTKPVSYNKQLFLVFLGAILPGIFAIVQTCLLGGDVDNLRGEIGDLETQLAASQKSLKATATEADTLRDTVNTLNTLVSGQEALIRELNLTSLEGRLTALGVVADEITSQVDAVGNLTKKLDDIAIASKVKIFSSAIDYDGTDFGSSNAEGGWKYMSLTNSFQQLVSIDVEVSQHSIIQCHSRNQMYVANNGGGTGGASVRMRLSTDTGTSLNDSKNSFLIGPSSDITSNVILQENYEIHSSGTVTVVVEAVDIYGSAAASTRCRVRYSSIHCQVYTV